jgi:hypothetical protein
VERGQGKMEYRSAAGRQIRCLRQGRAASGMARPAWQQVRRARLGTRDATARMDEQIAPPSMTAKGEVQVNITSNGTAARASASANGLFQETTVSNYKQMQRTEKPVGSIDQTQGP